MPRDHPNPRGGQKTKLVLTIRPDREVGASLVFKGTKENRIEAREKIPGRTAYVNRKKKVDFL